MKTDVKLNSEKAETRCIIYGRCSTGDQEVGNQLEQLEAYATKMEWGVVDTVTDICSGSKGVREREGLERVFDMCRRREADIVLFWSLDRLSREGSRATIAYLTQLDEYGVGWHSYSEPYISSLGVLRMQSLP